MIIYCFKIGCFIEISTGWITTDTVGACLLHLKHVNDNRWKICDSTNCKIGHNSTIITRCIHTVDRSSLPVPLCSIRNYSEAVFSFDATYSLFRRFGTDDLENFFNENIERKINSSQRQIRVTANNLNTRNVKELIETYLSNAQISHPDFVWGG